jgi:hypothetical protein
LPSRLGKEERTGRGALAHGEGAKQQNPGDDVGDRRNRPSVGGTSDKAVSQPYHRRAEQNRTGDEPDHRKPNVDEEHRPPVQPVDFGADDHASDDRA